MATLVAGAGAPYSELPAGSRADRAGHRQRARARQRPADGSIASTPTPARSPRTCTGSASAPAVGAPILVEGRLWGVLLAGASEPLPTRTEARLAEFAELAAVAIANAESRAELAGSRARIVSAADETRRRIERDLHDGIQQRLVSLGLELRDAQFAIADAPARGAAQDRRASPTASPARSTTCARSRAASTRRSSPPGWLPRSRRSRGAAGAGRARHRDARPGARADAGRDLLRRLRGVHERRQARRAPRSSAPGSRGARRARSGSR